VENHSSFVLLFFVSERAFHDCWEVDWEGSGVQVVDVVDWSVVQDAEVVEQAVVGV
jgi:hypothetical protein